MKIYKLHIFIITALIVATSCKERTLHEFEDISTVGSYETTSLSNESIEENIARIFLNSLHGDREYETPRSNDIKEIEFIPVEYNEVPVLWVANHSKGGYVIISADKSEFPIVAFSEKGRFDYSTLPDEERNYYNSKLKERYSRIKGGNNITDSLWINVFNLEKYSNSDTTCVVNVEFFTNQSQPLTRGSIPDRGYSKGYRDVWPLLASKNRQWNRFAPYNYDFKKPMYGSTCIPAMVVCMALVMDYHGIPDPLFWNSQPVAQTVSSSSQLTRFLSKLYTDFGGTYGSSSDIDLQSNALLNEIPNSLYKYYGFQYAKPEEYFCDQVGFDKIRYHLYNYGPAVIVWDVLRNWTLPYDAFVIDGVMEIYVKVTTTKYFLGIKVKTEVNYYYRDFFHYVSASGREYDSWEHYDWKVKTNNANKHYVFFLKRK